MLLRTLGVFLLVHVTVQLELYKESATCNSMKCPSNMFYYFECCSGECCLRLQLIPSIVIAAIAVVLTCVCCSACCCYCCFRD
ncbi:hypothetical protein Y032_0734g1932 [Ancylostoma ceylanicum]|uniref:Uncharacterized protein n=1 Tax=Ancylostoma ceylanicum TaxID=53326 RepID=A0A016WFY6_9BILA|nr:hypothetical protein Y032_0734g1932 [Ancylostoma ceylanicum]